MPRYRVPVRAICSVEAFIDISADDPISAITITNSIINMRGPDSSPRIDWETLGKWEVADHEDITIDHSYEET